MSTTVIGQPDPPAVEAIRLKVDRAHDQTHALAVAEMEYVDAEPCPYRVLRKVKVDFTEHVYYLRLETPIPLEFSILLGEIIYNLRSALDQCVFQLALNHTGVEKSQTMFPIFTDVDDFQKKGAWRIESVGDGPQALIESLQPYPDRSLAINHSLLDLNNLSNADKHRAVHLWGLSFLPGKMEVASGARIDPVGFAKVLHDGEKIFGVFPQSPTDQAQVRESISATVSIRNPTAAGRGVSLNLWDLIADVRVLVDALLHALDQDRPILVNWPTHGSNAPAW